MTAGFTKNDIKTTNFEVETICQSYHDADGNYEERFNCYRRSQELCLKFPFTSQLLSEAIGAVVGSKVNPRLDVLFTAKDKEAVCQQLLANAAKNARENAETLAKFANVTFVCQHDIRLPT